VRPAIRYSYGTPPRQSIAFLGIRIVAMLH